MTDRISAAAIQRLTGLPTTTLNVWVNRQLIPGVPTTTQGKTRMFDIDTVTHISVTVALVRLGYGAPFASIAALEALDKGADRLGARIVVTPPRRIMFGIGGSPAIDYFVVNSDRDLDDFLDGLPGGRPEGFSVIELDRIYDRVKRAFEEPAQSAGTEAA